VLTIAATVTTLSQMVLIRHDGDGRHSGRYWTLVLRVSDHERPRRASSSWLSHLRTGQVGATEIVSDGASTGRSGRGGSTPA
jgi:hypothetical protein